MSEMIERIARAIGEGDYPGLDRKRISWLSRLRQVGGLLVLFIYLSVSIAQAGDRKIDGEIGGLVVVGKFEHGPSRPPQSEGEQYKQRVSNFKAPSEERPVFGSLIGCLIGIAIASALYNRFRGISIFLAFLSTVGLLLGFDPWKLVSSIW